MNELNLLFCATYGIIGLLMVALSIPLLKGKIKKNLWYGVRIPKSFESEENWMVINQYGARRFIQFSLGFFLLSFFAAILPFSTMPWLLYALPMVLIILVTIPIIDVILYARKL